MKTTQVCKHVVGAPDSSLGDGYGAGLRPEIDSKTFEETGRYRDFHGYRPCLSCGAVIHMGLDIVDADGTVLERNGFDTSQIPIPKQWNLLGASYYTNILKLADFELTLAIDVSGEEAIAEIYLATEWLYLGAF